MDRFQIKANAAIVKGWYAKLAHRLVITGEMWASAAVMPRKRNRLTTVRNRLGRGGRNAADWGQGAVGATLAGVLLLGLIFNILNFENGLGWISRSAYWQSVIRGVFLMTVVIFQSRLVVRQRVTR